MVFFKTTEEKRRKEQERLKDLSERRVKHFALLPVKLHDGRVAWLQYVYREYFIYGCGGELMVDAHYTNYYLASYGDT